MFYLIFVFLTQIIESQTVYVFVDEIFKYVFHLSAFCYIHLTFKYRILHSLPIVGAFLRHLTQTFASFLCHNDCFVFHTSVRNSVTFPLTSPVTLARNLPFPDIKERLIFLCAHCLLQNSKCWIPDSWRKSSS